MSVHEISMVTQIPPISTANVRERYASSRSWLRRWHSGCPFHHMPEKLNSFSYRTGEWGGQALTAMEGEGKGKKSWRMAWKEKKWGQQYKLKLLDTWLIGLFLCWQYTCERSRRGYTMEIDLFRISQLAFCCYKWMLQLYPKFLPTFFTKQERLLNITTI